MNISIIGRHFEVTASIREYVEKQIDILLEDKALNVTSVNVVMEREKNRFKTTLIVNCKLHVVPAEFEDFDLYKSFDAVVAKVDSQLKTLREKIRDHHAQPVREAEANSELVVEKEE